mgnify:CR=1 FL=1|jgi:Heme/copper-type cytochrome/quinol oxidases, subunit 2
MLAGGTAIFLATSLVLAAALFRPAGLRVLGARRLILWGGLILPSIVLTALVAAALALGERLVVAGQAPAELRIEAVARQWTWEFRYPGGETTTDRLYLPVGRPVDVALVSSDVIHSFWIPRLGGKLDAIPGHVNVIRLSADRVGTYGGVCAEYCGSGHAPMRFIVEAREEAEFAELLAAANQTGGTE